MDEHGDVISDHSVWQVDGTSIVDAQECWACAQSAGGVCQEEALSLTVRARPGSNRAFYEPPCRASTFVYAASDPALSTLSTVSNGSQLLDQARGHRSAWTGDVEARKPLNDRGAGRRSQPTGTAARGPPKSTQVSGGEVEVEDEVRW